MSQWSFSTTAVGDSTEGFTTLFPSKAKSLWFSTTPRDWSALTLVDGTGGQPSNWPHVESGNGVASANGLTYSNRCRNVLAKLNDLTQPDNPDGTRAE